MKKVVVALLALMAAVCLPVSGHAQKFSVLYHFGANPGDPLYPQRIGAIVEGKDGALYTVAEQGGKYNRGAFFKVAPDGALTIVHHFDPVRDGGTPQGGVSLGKDGSFYGTCYAGGLRGIGTIWKCTPAGVFTVLHHFDGTNGSYPTSSPVQGRDGNFYGVTSYTGNYQAGVVYRISPTGGFTPLYKFNGKDAPTIGTFASALTLGADGTFYGTTYKGGKGFGTVYKVTPAGAVTALHVFDGIEGGSPANLLQGADGNLYGTCYVGGKANFGLVYRLTPAGQFTVLYQFTGKDGANPLAGVSQAADGYLYGATRYGGTGGRGVVFRILSSGAGFQVLHHRHLNMTEGMYCLQTPVIHSNGNLYGDTWQGGLKNAGVFYAIDLHIFRVAPATAKAGVNVTLTGLGFTGATGVTFNGVAAVFKVDSDTQITATVPMGAVGGVVKVVTPRGALTGDTPFVLAP